MSYSPLVSAREQLAELLSLATPDKCDDQSICPICDKPLYVIDSSLHCGDCGTLHIDEDGLLP